MKIKRLEQSICQSCTDELVDAMGDQLQPINQTSFVVIDASAAIRPSDFVDVLVEVYHIVQDTVDCDNHDA